MSARDNMTRCSDVAPLLVFYACDEVDAAERSSIETHLAACSVCSTQLAEEKALNTAFVDALQPAEQFDPSGILLSQCRSELAELLDDLAAPPVREQWRPFGWVRRWMTLRPAWSAAAFVLFGAVLGAQVLQWIPSHNGVNSTGQTVNVLARPQITEDQLSKMSVAGINFTPGQDSAPGTIQLQLRAEQPLVLSGNLDDTEVRRVLTYVIENDDRFDPGLRLDCLEALKSRTGDADVRHALLAAVRKDRNPAVRMKAIESLRDSGGDKAVREALLEALDHDANPGVRVEAVNLLLRAFENKPGEAADTVSTPGEDSIPPDPSVAHVVQTLEDLQRHDPNRYVRMRSAAALRRIEPHEVQ
ncbi:MAG: HEAT repeat domain-containing protein [Candidatus Acidiferrales bacterium]